MSDVFFEELKLRQPDYHLNIRGDWAEQIAQRIPQLRDILAKERPDRILVLGDTNTVHDASYVASRMGIKIYHMEAGNRSFDPTMPEEINRRRIDHTVDIHMPYSERSRANLLAEGIESSKIFVVGNPIKEVLDSVGPQEIPKYMPLQPGRFFLVTAHRQENVESEVRLAGIIKACVTLKDKYGLPIIFSAHPRTARNVEAWHIELGGIGLHEPLGFLEFLALEQNAKCVLSDSGTVQEECAILKVPCVTMRENTERPETLECGSNILSGTDPDNILRCVEVALSQRTDWEPPAEYRKVNVSDTVVRIVTGV